MEAVVERQKIAPGRGIPWQGFFVAAHLGNMTRVAL